MMSSPPRWPRNPFALADLLAAIRRRRIQWSVGNQVAELVDTLRIKPEGWNLAGHGPITLLNAYVEGGWLEKGFERASDALAVLREEAPSLFDNFDAALLAQVVPYLCPVRETSNRPPGAETDAITEPNALRSAGPSMLDASGASFLDPVQGVMPDCYLIASMIAIAWARPGPWANRLQKATAAVQATSNFDWSFFPEQRSFAVAPGVPVFTDPQDATHRVFTYARSKDAGEAWPAIVEKAFALRLNHPDSTPPPDLPLDQYHVLQNRGSAALERFKWPQQACAALCGGTPRPVAGDLKSVDSEATAEFRTLCEDGAADDCATTQPIMAVTWDVRGASDTAVLFKSEHIASGLVPEHCYALLGLARRAGEEFMVVRNPWSKDTDPALGSYLTGAWSPKLGLVERRVELNRFGVFAIPEIEFMRYFRSYCTVDAPQLE